MGIEMRTLNRKLKKLRRKQQKKLVKEIEVEKEEILMVKIKKGMSPSEGLEYRYVDETIFPSGHHVVNVINEDSIKGEDPAIYGIEKVTFLFHQHLRKRVNRYHKYPNLEYDPNKTWK